MAKKSTKSLKPRVVRRAPSTAPEKTSALARKVTKQDQVLALLRRAHGASIDEMVAATEWQPHSARGFLAGVVKRRLGIDVVSEKGSDGVRRYHVAALKS